MQISKTAEEVPGSNKKPAILLIEDNDDLRFYLKDNLKNIFHVIEAANGKDGWQKALALHPKLIVSDINMPGINGIELCRKIKTDTRTSHIPVILLTALTAEEDLRDGLNLAGFVTGQLRPMCILELGTLRDIYSGTSRYLIEAYKEGFIDQSDFPENFPKMAPREPKNPVNKALKARIDALTATA